MCRSICKRCSPRLTADRPYETIHSVGEFWLTNSVRFAHRVRLSSLSTVIKRNIMSNESAAAEGSLYERLGGVYSIAAVVDDFIDRIMDDPKLNANPKVDEAHHRVSRAGFKYLVTEMVCWATGGPQQYSGRTMKDSHLELDITEDEWQVFLVDFEQTLDKFEVPVAERQELFAIVDSTKADIVIG